MPDAGRGREAVDGSGLGGHHWPRDRMINLLAYRHGLRVLQLGTMRWEHIELKAGLMHGADPERNGLHARDAVDRSCARCESCGTSNESGAVQNLLAVLRSMGRVAKRDAAPGSLALILQRRGTSAPSQTSLSLAAIRFADPNPSFM
jgi:integrase